MFRNIKAVIFDMDGTLIDSMWLWKSIDIEYLKRHGHELPDDLQEAIEGMSFSETAMYFKDRFEIKDDVETIKSDWNEMAKGYYECRVPAKEHAIELLDYLKERGIKLGVGTSNSREMVNIIMRKFLLEEKFDSIRTSCEVEKGKPSPDIYLQVAKDLNVPPKECLVFEDVPNGIEAARRAGMQSVAVYDEFSIHLDDVKKEMSDYYIQSYKEAINALMEGN